LISPKSIDFILKDGQNKGALFLGIYELGEKTRTLCFAPAGKERPVELISRPGSEHVLIMLQRDLVEAARIERKRLEGIWKVVAMEVDGNKVMNDDARKLTVVIGADGSWSLAVEGKDVAQGTSTIDLNLVRGIDFLITQGNNQGQQSLGIFEVEETTLKFCVGGPDKERPTDFSSMPGSQRTLLMFEREKK
jgi:uncharacterized protein (TIGR03067 family)